MRFPPSVLLAGVVAAALAGLGCDFPHVPGGASSAIREGQRFQPIPSPETPGKPVASRVETRAGVEERTTATGPREIEGMLVSNAVSSLVIENREGGFVTVQVTPQTQLRIGDQVAGLREIQPGTAVRASFAPMGRNLDVALQVQADPSSQGWQRGRDMPKEKVEPKGGPKAE